MKRNKAILLAVMMVVISFGLSTLVSLHSLSVMSSDNTKEINTVLATKIYDAISCRLLEPISVSRTMAKDIFLADMLEKEEDYTREEAVRIMSRYLNGLKTGLGYKSAFVVSDKSKRYYSYEGLNKIVNPRTDAHDIWYSQFVDRDVDYNLDVDNDEVNGNAWTVFVNVRLKDKKGALLGVCGVGVQMKDLQDIFYGYEKEYGVKISLINQSGLVQVDTEEINIENAYLNDVEVDQKNSEEYRYQTGENNQYTVTKYIENLGWYLVVKSEKGSNERQFANLILLNGIVCTAFLLVLMIAVELIMRRTRVLTDASFKDSLTKMYNRRAYDERIHFLFNTPLRGDLVILMADVNGLKVVNDNLGHSAGDELIQGAAWCLQYCFDKYGKFYRIGGDEFAGILNISEEKLKEAKRGFDEAIKDWKGEKVPYLSISCGFASTKEFPEYSITDLVRVADEIMYKAKENYYQELEEAERRREEELRFPGDYPGINPL